MAAAEDSVIKYMADNPGASITEISDFIVSSGADLDTVADMAGVPRADARAAFSPTPSPAPNYDLLPNSYGSNDGNALAYVDYVNTELNDYIPGYSNTVNGMPAMTGVNSPSAILAAGIQNYGTGSVIPRNLNGAVNPTSGVTLGMAQSADAASANSSPFDLINGNTTGSPADAINNTAGPLPTYISPLEQLEIDLASDIAEQEAMYGTLDNNFQGTLNNKTFDPSAGSLIAAQNEVDAINAAGIAALTPPQIAAIDEANSLLAERQASQATIDAAAKVQQQDDDFQTRVNAAGGMNLGTIGLVIDAAQESFGDDTSRAIVTVIAEALKSGVTLDDLAAETGMTQAAIVAAAKDAGQDPNVKLSTKEMINGGLDTVYDVVNSAIDLVESGVNITGLDKLIDLAADTVAKVGGLIPSQASKVLNIDPTTGQITITASNQPGGGLGGYLPKNPYVPIGTTPGGTTYGMNTGNKVATVLFNKIRTNGGLDADDIPGLFGGAIYEATGIDPSLGTGIVADAAALISDAVKQIIPGEDDEVDTETTVSIGGLGTPGRSTPITGPLPSCPEGQTQINEPGDCYVVPATTIGNSGGPVTDDECPPGQTRNPLTGNCEVTALVPPAGNGGTPDDECPSGQTRNPLTGNCEVTAGGVVPPEGSGLNVPPVLTPDNECPLGQTRNPLTGNCEVTAGGVVPPVVPPVICPDGTALAGQDVPADGNCNPVGVILPPDGQPDPECPGGIYNEATDTCGYTDLSCSTIGFVLDRVTGFCKKPDTTETDDRTVVPPTTLGLPPRFVGESDVLVEDTRTYQAPYSILPPPVTDPYLADRRSRDILNVASSVGIQPGAEEQSQQAVDRFARYANKFDIGLPELSSITGTPVSEFPAFEEKYGISLPQIGTAPPVAPTSLDPVTGLPIRTPISGQRYVPEPTALLPTLPGEASMFADGGVVENGGGIESLLDRRQQAVNRMLTKRARGLM